MKPGVTIEDCEKDLLRARADLGKERQGKGRRRSRDRCARSSSATSRTPPSADRGGRAAAPRRLRQRGEPDARAGAAAPRDGHPPRAGRRPRGRQTAVRRNAYWHRRRRNRPRARPVGGELLAQVPDQLPHFASFGVDLRVVGFAILASMATVILFGWAPALHASRGDLRSAVHAATAA